ncbi:class I SAM-dependent methyltransferase [Mycobacterium alsense]|uniref:class I SAM-dependent methyltransferase n=1 Tax=Mycobacterium alsense TaxID=324058 RepID=UPI001F603AB5|nr:class I SAM-dependent methyltransferase [Mycobacterium alsense]
MVVPLLRASLAWDHNAYYQRTLLRQLPRRCGRVLDVGCGAGAFAARLASRTERVDAVDRSAAMISAARRRAPANVTCVHADVLELPLPGEHYDAIVSNTALHHLPLADALRHLAPALRPGGVLAAVVLPRPDLPREAVTEIAAAAANRALGAAFAALRATGRGDWYGLDPTHEAMPKVVDPPLTTRRAREVAAATLPPARVRRLLFWRYLLVWRRPAMWPLSCGGDARC